MHHGMKLSKTHCPSSSDERYRMSRIPYDSTILIMCAMTCTCADVSNALSMVSQYQENHGLSHWIVVKNILKYLRYTKDMFLVYGGEQELFMKRYGDVSFQTNRDDSNSQF